MSKKDKELLKKINLKQKVIAHVMGISQPSLSRKLRKNEDIVGETELCGAIDVSAGDRWADFYSSKTNRNETLENIVTELDQRISPRIRKAREAMELLGGASQGIWLVTEAGFIASNIGGLVTPSNPLEALVIAAHSELSEQAIAGIESWAYGLHGDYLTRRKIKLVELESPPITEMVGGYKDGVFHGFMDVGEGFVPLDIPELSLLKDELEALMREELPEGASSKWSLPVSPEARIIGHLIRHAEPPLPEDAKDYLIEMEKGFEAESGSFDADTPWKRLYGMLPLEIGNRFGSETGGHIKAAMEKLKMEAI